MTGDSDYLIRVAVADIAALEKFILEQLTPIAGIEKIRSSFALKQVRYKTALPLPAPVLTDTRRRDLRDRRMGADRPAAHPPRGSRALRRITGSGDAATMDPWTRCIRSLTPSGGKAGTGPSGRP